MVLMVMALPWSVIEVRDDQINVGIRHCFLHFVHVHVKSHRFIIFVIVCLHVHFVI